MLNVGQQPPVASRPELSPPNAAAEHRRNPVKGRVPVIEADDGQPTRLSGRVLFPRRPSACRGCGGAHRRSRRRRKRHRRTGAAPRPRAPAASRVSSAKRCRVKARWVAVRSIAYSRSRAGELRVISAETRADLENATAGKGLESDGFLQPGRVYVVAMILDAAKEGPGRPARAPPPHPPRRGWCSTGAGNELGINLGHERSAAPREARGVCSWLE